MVSLSPHFVISFFLLTSHPLSSPNHLIIHPPSQTHLRFTTPTFFSVSLHTCFLSSTLTLLLSSLSSSISSLFLNLHLSHPIHLPISLYLHIALVFPFPSSSSFPFLFLFNLLFCLSTFPCPHRSHIDSEVEISAPKNKDIISNSYLSRLKKREALIFSDFLLTKNDGYFSIFIGKYPSFCYLQNIKKKTESWAKFLAMVRFS